MIGPRAELEPALLGVEGEICNVNNTGTLDERRVFVLYCSVVIYSAHKLISDWVHFFFCGTAIKKILSSDYMTIMSVRVGCKIISRGLPLEIKKNKHGRISILSSQKE